MWDVTVENNEFREKGGCCYLEVEVTVRSAVLCEILKYQNYATKLCQRSRFKNLNCRIMI